MANHASASKRIRSNATKRTLNRYQLKSCRTAIKKLRTLKTADQAAPQLPLIHAMLDKLAKRNIIHKNKSASMKSKLTKHVNQLKGSPKPVASPKKAAPKKKTAKKEAPAKASAKKSS